MFLLPGEAEGFSQDEGVVGYQLRVEVSIAIFSIYCLDEPLEGRENRGF